jgi:outer membrane protein OmpA-like peptidoglycan-associated protein
VPRLSQNAPENTLVDSIITSNEANAHVVIPPTPAPDERYTAKPDNATEAAQPSSYPATLPDKADLALLATVYFDLGVIEPTLSTEDTNFLATLDKTKKYYLYGHTDNVTVRPNALYKDNFELSRLRADKIMSILVGIGMNPASIKTTGLGTLYPVVANSSSTAGTAQNRRVEIYEDRTSGEI